MDFWLKPKEFLSGILIGAAFLAGIVAGYGTFASYAGGWGTLICAGVGVSCYIASDLVKKIPI